ncbi:MAG: hypothetical protein Q7U97_12810 [Rhodocyclaceae bacterium]|nr:hypothetical protein [Rhodocyclaceae bacterium]
MFSPPSRWAVLLLCLLALPGRAAQISLSLDSIRHDAFEADGVTLAFDAARQGEADIRLRRLLVAGVEYKELRLHCSGFYFDGRRLDCPNGTLRRDDARGRDRAPLPFSLAYRASDGFFEFALKDADVVALSPLIKRLRGWQPAGRVDFRIAAQDGKARLHFALRDLAFANKEGDIAGKGIALTLDVDAERQRDGWNWQARFDWPQGELRHAPWKRAAGVKASAEGTYSAAEIDVRQARVETAGIGAVNASLRWDRERGEATAWGFVTERLDLATAMREWVQPWLAGLGFPSWSTSGHALFAAESQDGRLKRFYAGLEDATLTDGTGHVELAGVNARIPWEDGAATEADFGVAGGRLGDLPLGGFRFPLHIAGREARVSDLVAPMLDGKFAVEDLRIARRDDGWHGEFAGGIDGVSMPKLSRALGMPAMDGNLTARIPRVSYAGGVLALDGALAMEVFDGGLIVHRLRVIDAFGSERRFVADVTARGLDLGMLTRTFSFGSIEGRFDADLHDLEMAGWKPVRFDVRIADSPGDYPRILSLGALQDITSLGDGTGGEGKAVDTIRRMPERAIGGFGYAHIGIGGKLRDGVFLLAGVGRDGDGVVLMEGRGIPSVRIIGYNPRVDWEALVARIREVIAGKPGVLIE